MARGPKATAIHSSEDERAELERIIRRRRTGQALVQRARIVLACGEPDATNAGVARALSVRRPSVTTWRARFAAHRLDCPAARLAGLQATRPGGAHPSPSTLGRLCQSLPLRRPGSWWRHDQRFTKIRLDHLIGSLVSCWGELHGIRSQAEYKGGK